MSEISINLSYGQSIGLSLEKEDNAIGIGLEPGGGGGSAETAKRLKTPRTIAIGGEAVGETLFDGSEDITIYTAIERLTNEELEELLK